MKNENVLTPEQQKQIWDIAGEACSKTPKLKFETCYTTTLLYYLTQFCEYKISNIPPYYRNTVELLYKNPKSSYLHYWHNIMYSNNVYAKAIKKAEIQVMGDDPRCPW